MSSGPVYVVGRGRLRTELEQLELPPASSKYEITPGPERVFIQEKLREHSLCWKLDKLGQELFFPRRRESLPL